MSNTSMSQEVKSVLQDLMEALKANPKLKVRADGPYGEADVHSSWAESDNLILIAGGIGVSLLLCFWNS